MSPMTSASTPTATRAGVHHRRVSGVLFSVLLHTPNSKDQLARLDYRMAWEDDIQDYLLELDAQKPVVVLRGPERGP